MKKRTTAFLLMAVIILSAVMMTSCGSSPVGFWTVDEITAGDVVMTESDARSIGLGRIGSVKLQKSGNCEVVLLGEERTGTWEQAEDGTIVVDCSAEELKLTGEIDEEGVMHLTDEQGSVYTLSK